MKNNKIQEFLNRPRNNKKTILEIAKELGMDISKIKKDTTYVDLMMPFAEDLEKK